MPRVGFEPTVPVFERAKIVHALDGARGNRDRYCALFVKYEGKPMCLIKHHSMKT
jgi:hypothetical protein